MGCKLFALFTLCTGAGLAATLTAGCASERATLTLLSGATTTDGSARAFTAGAAPDDRGRTVYTFHDENTVDVYFSDVPMAALDAWRRGEDAPTWTSGGVLGHLHLFLWPRAGRTPIDFEASNATITLMTIAPSETGEPSAVVTYSGGGFVLPSSFDAEPGGRWFTARTRGATVQLRAMSPAASAPFTDAEARGRVRARLDQDAARRIAAAMLALAGVTRPVEAEMDQHGEDAGGGADEGRGTAIDGGASLRRS